MPMTGGTFNRIWKFVDQFLSGDDITRADMDIAVDDVVDGVNYVLGAVVDLPDIRQDIIDNADVISGVAGDVEGAVVFSHTWFDDVADMENDRVLTYAGEGQIVALGDYVSTRVGPVFQVAASGAVDAHHQTDHATTPVKVYEAGRAFSTLDRFKAAITRGETYRTGSTVYAAGVAYKYLADGNTNIFGLTGWAYASIAVGAVGVASATGVIATPTTTTPGNLMTVGAFGLGEVGTAPLLADINATATAGGLWRYDGTTTGTMPAGIPADGFVWIGRGKNATSLLQILVGEDGLAMFSRACDTGSFSAWIYGLSDLDIDSAADMGGVSPSAMKLPNQIAVQGYIAANTQTTYTSPETTLATSVDVAHGLGGLPDEYSVHLRCKTTDRGWAVGDEIPITTQQDTSGVVTAASYVSATNVGWRASSVGLRLPNKGTPGAPGTITPANWKLVFRARRDA